MYNPETVLVTNKPSSPISIQDMFVFCPTISSEIRKTDFIRFVYVFLYFSASSEKAAASDTRKCVHSRAFHAAQKAARDKGLSKEEVSKAASLAAKQATAQWDKDHA